ncbi:hypothetical protein SAMN04487886_106011 [Clostridium sp. DSM 8431]|nr:hypothetical protein SAMN04487886_106011 [Clostridium sp. DSM 8431]
MKDKKFFLNNTNPSFFECDFQWYRLHLDFIKEKSEKCRFQYLKVAKIVV